MILSKEIKMEALSQIIDREFEVRIHKLTKKKEYVNARKVFCKILNDIGFSAHDVCGFLDRSHAVYNYYITDADLLLKYHPEVNEKYLKSKELFFATIRGVLKEDVNYVVDARSKINYSVWDKDGLNKGAVEYKHDRIKNIIELVDFNTPIGREGLVFEKLVQVFETLSDDGKENRRRK
jgi:hypothetical protein